jgi:hypothetical protein
MTMRTPLRILALGAVLASSGLVAQDTSKSWTAGVSLTAALDGLKEVTHETNGFVVDFGYNGRLGNTTVPFRASLGYQIFPGSAAETGLKQSLTSIQLAGDIFISSPWKDLQFITGLSLNKYKVKSESATFSTTESVEGTKFGARLGMEYQFNPAWSAQLLVQMTELGTDSAASTGVNPSWLQAGVKFHF